MSEAIRLFLEEKSWDLTELQRKELISFSEMWYENRDRIKLQDVEGDHEEIEVSCIIDTPEKAHLVAKVIHELLITVQ